MEKFKKGLIWFFKSFIWLGVLLLLIDVLSKYFVTLNKEYILSNTLKNGDSGIDLIPGFLGIGYLINNNVAFGAGSPNPVVNRTLFIIISLIIAIAAIIYLIVKWDKTRKLYKAVGMMIIAGALGNASDRIFYSAAFQSSSAGIIEVPGVVDFIDFYGIWKFKFNIADCCIVIGAFILIIALIVGAIKESMENKKKEEKKEKKPVEKVLSKTEIETQKLREEDQNKNE